MARGRVRISRRYFQAGHRVLNSVIEAVTNLAATSDELGDATCSIVERRQSALGSSGTPIC